MEKWKQLHSQYVYQTPFGNLRKDSCQLPGGHIIENYYVQEYADWVNAIVLTEDWQVVLVKQFRYAANDFFLEIPAGKVEREESYEEAIFREVKEETGYISNKKPIFMGDFFVNPATQNNKIYTYLIMDAFLKFDQDLDETEIVKVELVRYDEMERLIKEKKINQFFTVSAFYMSKAYVQKG